MAIEVVCVPCQSDNYAFLIHAGDRVAVVDVPEVAPIAAALASRGWRASDILITHHHDDHIQGVDALRAATGAQVWGAQADAHRLPALDHALAGGDLVSLGPVEGRVIEVPGHTRGHIAYAFPGHVFTGDSLMAGGCGRLFEGTAEEMWASLGKLAALPDETWVCSGHEYTAKNLAFAATIDGANPALQGRIAKVAAARAEGRATVPSRLEGEKATNIFLRAADPAVKSALGLAGAADVAVFAALREARNRF